MNAITLTVRAQNTLTNAASGVATRIKRARNENGEGVISAAIAVLIMAVIGGLMYVGYVQIFKNSAKKTSDIVNDGITSVASDVKAL